MFRIMFVCTGNRCRSPFAHAYLARRTRHLPVEVTSAGTLDAPDQRVPRELIEIGHHSGLDLASHRSRVLAGEDLSDVDLLIGFEHRHVAGAVVERAFPVERAFTLPELVRLLGEIEPPPDGEPEARARHAVTAASHRRLNSSTSNQGEEIADPFRRSVAVYQASADEIASLCKQLVEHLFGESSPR